MNSLAMIHEDFYDVQDNLRDYVSLVHLISHSNLDIAKYTIDFIANLFTGYYNK